MDQNFLIKVVLMVLVSFLASALTMPIFKKLAFQINAIDVPRTRHIHTTVMPKLGGLGIFLSFLLGYMLFGETSSQMNSILIGGFLIIITGIIDDIAELKPAYKFFGQLLAALVIVFYGQFVINEVSAFNIVLHFGWFGYPLTLFFILGCINCMDLIDGIDGLSGGISAIYFLTIGIICIMQGGQGLEVVLTFVMLGATLGFLVHNFHPASIFAGDTGAMFMGFIISVIALLGFKNVTITSIVIPLLVLAIPIFDTLCAIIRRALKGESIAKADKFHIHHQFLNRHFTQTQTVLIIYAIDLLFAFASIVYVTHSQILGYIVYGVILVLTILFVIKTDIIIEHKNKNN